ncbi:MAG: hypothetical protein PHY08_01530 [Candidatus Cloacimonetes bacterium]|nr:hypothetical protein [Candidatus Cloacimonadota bacterium]MDD4155229.1 hypothetical protein [Candidatus Cloacimonadota bacterium]
MYKKNKLQATKSIFMNNRGFALAETIAATAILSFALVGIMMMVEYARVRAVVNYHDRYVLLRTNGELQKIKYQHFVHNNFGLLNPVEFTIPQNTKRDRGPEVPVKINFQVNFATDLDVGLDVGYNSVTAIAQWQEYKPLFVDKRTKAQKRYIQLREDYYILRSTPWF